MCFLKRTPLKSSKIMGSDVFTHSCRNHSSCNRALRRCRIPQYFTPVYPATSEVPCCTSKILLFYFLWINFFKIALLQRHRKTDDTSWLRMCRYDPGDRRCRPLLERRTYGRRNYKESWDHDSCRLPPHAAAGGWNDQPAVVAAGGWTPFFDGPHALGRTLWNVEKRTVLK